MPPERRRSMLASLDLTAETPSTLTSVLQIEEECARILRDGYAMDDEEFLLGLIAVAVPVRSPSGTVVAAIACHAPSARLSLAEAVRRLPELQEAARKVGATLPE